MQNGSSDDWARFFKTLDFFFTQVRQLATLLIKAAMR